MTSLSMLRRHPRVVDELDEIETFAEAFEVPAGAVVMQEGEPAGGFFVVLSGEFTVLLEAEPTAIVLGTVGPGGCFGEIDLLRWGVHSTTVRAATAGEVVVLGENALRAIITDAAAAGVDLPKAAAAYVGVLDWEAETA
ncbi:MAG: cyclic nucleotide-binding domain-containing protein [Mycobacteriales bacterium]